MLKASVFRQPILRAVIAFIIIYPLINSIAFFYGDKYGESLIPLYISSAHLFNDNYRINELSIIQHRQQKQFHASLVNRKDRQIGEHKFPANIDGSSSTLLGHALQHLILISTIIVVWLVYCAKPWYYSVLTIIMATFSLLIVEIIDVPLVLLGAMEDVVFASVAPANIGSSPIITWMHFLNGGGRLALSICAALLSITVSESIFYNPRRRLSKKD